MAKDKLFYKIGEACKMLDIQPYVLRYWETEFPILNPNKSRSGQRVYGDEDFALIRRIKELLYDEGFTIAGAKKKLESEIAEGGVKTHSAAPASKAAAKATADDEGAAEDEAESADVARLRAGIEKALEEARDILDFLDR